jgi:DNA polymerase I
MSNLTLRGCIRSEDGYTFLSLDASQIELRVLAYLSQDPRMLEDVKSSDLHMATAIRMYGLTDDKEEMTRRRYRAKQGNFSNVYGAGDEKLAEILDCEVDEAILFREEHKATYPRLYEYIKEAKEKAVQDGYVVTMHGRIRPIPELQAGSRSMREKAEKEAFNTIIQGSAVDIVKLMMIQLRKIYPREIRLVLQVHDEMLWEVPDTLLSWAIEQTEILGELFPDYPCEVKVGKYYNELVGV